MLDEKLALQLTRLGLSNAQAKVFLTLHTLGKTNIKTISTAAKIDRSNLYRTISQLQEIGIVNLFLGNPNLYSSLYLNDALDVLLRRKKEKFDEFLKAAEEIRKISRDNPQELDINNSMFQITAAKQGQRIALKRVFLSATTTHDGVITCFNYIRAMLNPEIRCIFEKSMARGVNFRYLIYYNKKEEKNEALRLIKKFFSSFPGAIDVRFIESPPKVIFAIIDRREVLMHIQPPPNWSGSQCLDSTNSCLTSVFQKYFDVLWEETGKTSNIVSKRVVPSKTNA